MKMDKKCLKNNRIEVPSQLQINTLLEHYQNRRFIDAEKLAVFITRKFPENQFAWKVLGAILKLTGRISEALAVGRKSSQISPLDEEAHNNLGTILQELERYDEAEESYKKAIALKPDFAGAHNNLGTILQELARYHEAETNFIKAISLTPDYAEAYCNLGNALHKRENLKKQK